MGGIKSGFGNNGGGCGSYYSRCGNNSWGSANVSWSYGGNSIRRVVSGDSLKSGVLWLEWEYNFFVSNNS